MAQAPTDVRDVILRDGSTLRLRRPRAADQDALLAFFSRLSDRSLYYRFHGLPAVGPRLVAPFLDPDGVERDALMGTLVEEGEEVEWILDEMASEEGLAVAFREWEPLIEGIPRLAREEFFWQREELV